jgi:hypothetical protein
MTRSGRRSTGAESVSAVPPRDASAPGGVVIEEIGNCFLLRSADERPREQVELIGALASGREEAVVVVAVSDDRAEAMWPRLGEILSRVRGEPRPVVLAMSDAGRGRPDQAALARRIADAWELTVVAPAGDVILVPGGTMFAHAADGDAEPQWWSFEPKAEPIALGLRWPTPDWRGALTGVTISPGGPVLTAVPAGMFVQWAGTPPPTPGDLAYAIPAVGDRPSVLVGPKVTAADLAGVLSGPVSRPEWRRHPLRLVPVGAGDLLPIGQGVASELGVEVAVLTGTPVDVAETPRGPAGRRVVLLNEAGRPSWAPFAASVLCRPAGRDGVVPPPQVLDWHPPVTGMRVVDAARGVLRLGDAWRIAMTRAGLWAYPADADAETHPDRLTAAWPVASDTLRIDMGTSGRTIDDDLWPLLDDLLGGLRPGPRARLHLAVHGETTVEGEEAVRKLAARHGAELQQVEPPAERAENAALARTAAAVPPTPHIPPPAPATDAPAPATDATAPAAATATPVTPARRGTDEDRAAFRAMVGLGWDAHAAPVRRAFSRLPAIVATERAAAAVDLVALRLYLTSRADGEFGPDTVRPGGAELRPYLSCLASGLARLPTYRGAVLHGTDAPVPAGLTGTVLTEPGPVGGLPLASATGWPPTATVYVIWSDTARRVAALFDGEGGPAAGRGDVVFGPGSRFAVLDVRPGDTDTPDLVLLRELETSFPEGTGETPPGGRLALTRLEEALDRTRPRSAVAPAEWPPHGLGPIGAPASAHGRA